MTKSGTYIEYANQTLKDFASQTAERQNALVGELGDAKIERVLDVGCGAGLQLLQFAEQKRAFCVGIDIGEEVGEIGNAVFRERNLENSGAFVRSRGERLPFADESFDVVLCRVALPYMDNRKTISEISRVLRPQGKFFLKTHAPLFYFGMMKKRFSSFNAKQMAYPVICLTAGALNLLTGKHPAGKFWQGKEVFQTDGFLKREFAKNGLRLIKEMADSNLESKSFLIEKS